MRAAEEDRAAKDAEVDQLTSQLAAASADQQRLTEVESGANTLNAIVRVLCAYCVHAPTSCTHHKCSPNVSVRDCTLLLRQGRQALHIAIPNELISRKDLAVCYHNQAWHGTCQSVI